MKKMDVLVDLQFGSTGKGLLAGWLGVKNGYDAVISCNCPNAGHSAYSPDTDQLFVHKVLPSAIFGKDLLDVGIGPGAVFDIGRLAEEWKGVCDYRTDLRLVIHEAAGILKPDHKKREQENLSRISSTMQGSAEALIDKIRRIDGATAGSHKELIYNACHRFGANVTVVTNSTWLNVFKHRDNVLLEGSQGYSLGISAGFYPFCTSRDCTAARVIADCGLPVGWLRDVYGSCRVHPIRVGNTHDGYSGSWYPDQTEISFSDLGKPEEYTTVTKRVRRIATFSEIQIREAMEMATPTAVFLNFANYGDEAAAAAADSIDKVATEIGCGGVRFIGMGPRPSDITEVE